MSNASIRRLIGGLGTGLVFLICAVLIVIHFVSGGDVQRIDASAYTNVYTDERGGYTAKLDVDRMIYEERLSNPPESELQNHPEIRALRLLTVDVSPKGNDYELKICMPEGEDLNELLQKNGIRLTNIKWTLSEAQMAAAAQTRAAAETAQKTLNLEKYICTSKDDTGNYSAVLDLSRMMTDAGVDVNADTETNAAARVLRSLQVRCTKSGEGYLLELTSYLPTVAEDLKAAGLSVPTVKLSWTEQEMEAHLGEAATLPIPGQQSSRELDMRSYICTERLENGDFAAKVDVYRMLVDSGVGVDTDPETDIGARALRSLNVSCTKVAEGYQIATLSTLTTVMDDLKAADLKITNTKWTWSTAEMEAHLGTVTPLPEPDSASAKGIDMRSYVRTERDGNGDYKVGVDVYQMLVDAGIDVAADPETDLGAKVLRSLGVNCTKTEDGYRFSTVSTLPSVMDDIRAAGLKISNTSWTWTAAEMEAHLGTVTQLPAPASTAAPVEPTAAPGTQDPGPSEPATTEPATPTPSTPAPSRNTIKTLYGFDQTEVRKAIREAKKQKYGTGFESSEVKYNYFAVGQDGSEHGNVFRVVYLITASGSTEYLIADVYDLESETGYTASDVHLTATSDRNTAKSTSDLAAYQVYTLSGGSMVFPENEGKSPYDANGLVMAKSVSESVSYDELWDIPQTSEMTLLQLLGYARNEMFARGGHKFGDSSNYFKYFSQFSWYKPTGKVSADELAAIYPATKKNISTIKFLETLIKEG